MFGRPLESLHGVAAADRDHRSSISGTRGGRGAAGKPPRFVRPHRVDAPALLPIAAGTDGRPATGSGVGVPGGGAGAVTAGGAVVVVGVAPVVVGVAPVVVGVAPVVGGAAPVVGGAAVAVSLPGAGTAAGAGTGCGPGAGRRTPPGSLPRRTANARSQQSPQSATASIVIGT
jgi:hypothetical protein